MSAAGGSSRVSTLGYPRVHLRRTGSTNERARSLAAAGAPHGTLVSAAEQTAGRGRQGRTWWAPAGSSLLVSLLVREPPRLLPLIAAVAVCDAAGESAAVKWPNDIVVRRPGAPGAPSPSPGEPGGGDSSTPVLAKLVGVLVEGRPQEGWAVVGIGVNVAVRPEDLPPELSATAASLALPASQMEPLLHRLLGALDRRLGESEPAVLDAWRARDALRGQEIYWQPSGRGVAEGVDEHGRLLVRLPDGTVTALSAGEVHLSAC
jgi:BirA family transcriptional regulator, biotin operon repressor / biotin---[acetyl-CoA-carboxylase] ligase